MIKKRRIQWPLYYKVLESQLFRDYSITTIHYLSSHSEFIPHLFLSKLVVYIIVKWDPNNNNKNWSLTILSLLTSTNLHPDILRVWSQVELSTFLIAPKHTRCWMWRPMQHVGNNQQKRETQLCLFV